MSDMHEKLREDATTLERGDCDAPECHVGSLCEWCATRARLHAAAEALADLGPLLDKLQRMHPFHAVCGCAPCQLWAAWTTARAKLVTT